MLPVRVPHGIDQGEPRRGSGSPRDSGSPTLAARVLALLERRLSPITAVTALRCAARRAQLDLEPLTARELPRLTQELEQSLRLYLESHEAVVACREIRTLHLQPDTTPPPSRSGEYRLSDEGDVVKVRGAALALAQEIGFDHVDAVKVATVVSEFARNVVQYAASGSITLTALTKPRAGVEVLAEDAGPGIPNLAEILAGSYRSRTGMGLGLAGSRRLMDELTVDTSPSGTHILARKYVPQ